MNLVGLGEGKKIAHLREIDGLGLKRAAQTGVDGEPGSECERGRLRQSRLRKIVKQAGVILVNGL